MSSGKNGVVLHIIDQPKVSMGVVRECLYFLNNDDSPFKLLEKTTSFLQYTSYSLYLTLHNTHYTHAYCEQ